MTQDEIIEMARQAGGQVTEWVNQSTIQKTTTFTFESPIDYYVSGEYPEKYHIKFLERFAKLVTAKTIAELESQEPVAWLLTEKNINSLQVDSIQLLINRLKHAHHTDLCVRINGQDEWFQADWLKHMVRVTPLQRTWVGLTADEIWDEWLEQSKPERNTHNFVVAFTRAIEAKLKEKNNG